MSLKKISLVSLAILVICSGFALPCQAQNTFRQRRPLRWLGQGFSDGYHRHNPGYDTSYYNPYSAHNSNLISQSPEYMAIHPVPTNQQLPRRFFNGIPFSAYAAPPQLNSTMQTLPGQQFQGSFSPSIDEDEDEDDFSENSFGRNDDDANEAEDSNFRDDDNDFREEENDGPVDMNDDEDLDVEGNDDVGEEMDDVGEELDGDSDDLGGLSDLNDSLSFDFD